MGRREGTARARHRGAGAAETESEQEKGGNMGPGGTWSPGRGAPVIICPSVAAL